MQPVRETLFASDAWIKGIGIARSYDRVEDIPDGRSVQCGRLANLQHLLVRGLTQQANRRVPVGESPPVRVRVERKVRQHWMAYAVAMTGASETPTRQLRYRVQAWRTERPTIERAVATPHWLKCERCKPQNDRPHRPGRMQLPTKECVVLARRRRAEHQRRRRR